MSNNKTLEKFVPQPTSQKEPNLAMQVKSTSDEGKYVFEYNRCKIALKFSSDSNGEAVALAKKILNSSTLYQNNLEMDGVVS